MLFIMAFSMPHYDYVKDLFIHSLLIQLNEIVLIYFAYYFAYLNYHLFNESEQYFIVKLLCLLLC